MTKDTILLIDFDSTFVSVESLEELCKIAVKEKKNKHEILKEIDSITRQGMEGKISFAESLDRRLKLFKAYKKSCGEAQ